MGTEDFTHIKPVVGSGGDNIKLVSQAWGDPVSDTGLVGNGGGNIQPAGLFSTAPYRPPAKSGFIPVEERIKCVGKDGTCKNTYKLRPNGLCPGCDGSRRARLKKQERAAAWSMDPEEPVGR